MNVGAAIRGALNVLLALTGMGLMIFYSLCDSSCRYLKGNLLGVELQYVGIVFMGLLLALTLPLPGRRGLMVEHLRTALLSGALGGEALLVRFQIVNDAYCPLCLAFGACVVLLFALNFTAMSRPLALGSFLAGLAVFGLFFSGSVLPLY
ncbi:MAG: hypothetical protein QM278_09740 [Pseudomonadota bacterium]|nr:hypothetical protein [Pseudomonadota bacterium]